jgi:hypothetical protein
MSRRPARCTKADIKRAIEAAKEAGAHMAVEILADGTIQMVEASEAEADASHEVALSNYRWREGFIYFIRSHRMGAIKIGFATDVEKRMRSLKTAIAGDIELLGTVAGNVDDERALHDRFSAYRISGEWFEPADEIITHIGGLRGSP